jgi:hypothetical protein
MFTSQLNDSLFLTDSHREFPVYGGWRLRARKRHRPGSARKRVRKILPSLIGFPCRIVLVDRHDDLVSSFSSASIGWVMSNE